tara:strand:- start:15343 stop:17304 length:1962 start_codon:yes stop_codon:yes gene_type:complete
MVDNTKHKALFSPIKIGKTTLKNRFVHTATVTGYGANTAPTKKLINYHAKLAKNSVAMIVTELMPIHPTSIANPFLVSAFDRKNKKLFKQWAESVSTHGSHLIGQIGHVGRQQLWNPLSTPISASTEPDPLSWTVPRAMTIKDIDEIVQGFCDSARLLSETGFSGVELHGAHGYLLTQFMSPFSNKRNDSYGGNTENRLRIIVEITKLIREKCGNDFIVGLKMPCDEGVKGGIKPKEAAKIGKYIKDNIAIDYLCFSQGNFSPSLEDHLPDMHFPNRPFQNIHADLKKKLPDIPIITVGKIESADAAEEIISKGKADLVGFSRAFVSDPKLVTKISCGEDNLIRHCIYCNFCWGEIHAGRGMRCIHGNYESNINRPRKSKASNKRIIVIGSGIAGLEAAAVASELSSEVHLFSNNRDVGGKLQWEAELPGRSIIKKEIEFQKYRIDKNKVNIIHGLANLKKIIELQPDHVVLATGADFSWPSSLPRKSKAKDIINSSYPIIHKKGVSDGKAVIFDQDHSAACYAVAELFASKYRKVFVVTSKATIGSKVNYISMLGIFRRLLNLKIEIIPFSLPIDYNGKALKLINAINQEENEIDDVEQFCFATPKIPRVSLLEPLSELGINCILAGDCDSPRGLAAAINDGYKISKEIENN